LLPPVGFLPINLGQLAPVVGRVRGLAAAVGAKDAAVAPTAFSVNQGAVLRNLALVGEEPLAAVESRLDQVGAQSGFNAVTFFGDVGSCGGFLDWEVADFALRQSWTRDPVDVTAGQITDASGDAVPPILFYCVDQNITAAFAAAQSAGSPLFYLVFIKTGRWVNGAQLPITAIQNPLLLILRG
jgi:hypothetical protein